MGTEIEYINLQVGLGTFMPIKASDLNRHKMHKESYEIEISVAKRLNKARKLGKRMIMVGTTVVRALEDNYKIFKKFESGEFNTNIFITNMEQFKVTDALLTNFHLPKSTLLVLVSAMIGREKALKIYDEAVKRKYAFFSYGDAMLIL